LDVRFHIFGTAPWSDSRLEVEGLRSILSATQLLALKLLAKSKSFGIDARRSRERFS